MKGARRDLPSRVRRPRTGAPWSSHVTSSSAGTPTVLVLNQFALPLTQAGGTRHVELFGALRHWSAVIVAGDRNLYTQDRFSAASASFKAVRVRRYGRGRLDRIVSWLSYCLSALWLVLRGGVGGCQVVYASTPHLLTPCVGLLVARLRRVPFVLEVRDLWPRTLVELGELRQGSALHRALSAVETFLYRRAAAVVVVTAGWEDYLQERGVPRAAVHVVTNGADLDVLESALSKTQAKQRLGLDGPVAIFAGAHGVKDGLDQIIDAAGTCLDVTFLLVGDGGDKIRLQSRVVEEGLPNVVFLQPVPKQALGDVLAAADVGLHTVADIDLFKQGMSPNKLYDYMAAALPVVTTAGGAIARLVEESGAGLATTPGAVAEGVHRLLEDAGSARRCGQAGRSYVDRHAARRVMAERLERVLDDVIQRSPR